MKALQSTIAGKWEQGIFEKAIAQTNRKMSKIETVFLLTSADTSYISSSIVRDILVNKGDVSMLVPPAVITDDIP